MVARYDYDFGNGSDNPPNKQSSSLERTLQVVSIAGGIVGIIAGIVSLWRGGPRYLIWILVGVAVLLIISVIYKPFKTQLQVWADRRKDRRVAHRNWPEFKKFVHRYGEFVDTRTNTTLHFIVANNLSEPSRTEFAKRLGTPNVGLWYEFWHFFRLRADRQRHTFFELQQAFPEFHYMVSAYNNLCVAAIFEYLPAELRSALSPTDKSTLTGFQQSFANFIDDYTAFAKELSQSRPSLQGQPYYLQRPKPL